MSQGNETPLPSVGPYVPSSVDGAATKADPSEEWHAALAECIKCASDLAGLDIPKRQPIIAPWFLEGDQGYIYGRRGLGKTWLALHCAIAIATGEKFGPWATQSARKVLYVDGEMPADGMLERVGQLNHGSLPDNLLLLHHEAAFHLRGIELDLSDPRMQGALMEYVHSNEVGVIFIDNISALMGRVKENDADSWAQSIGAWILQLRRRKIAVILVHHAGRNGKMRGTSKREDSAFWSLCLNESRDDDATREGAAFVATFDKNRNALDVDCPPLAWKFKADGADVLPLWTKREPIDILVDLVEGGLDSCRDIAEEMGYTKGNVSKIAKKAEARGLIEKANGKYRPKSGR